MLSTNPCVEGKVEPLPYHTPTWRGQGRGGEPPPPFDIPPTEGVSQGGVPPLPTFDLPQVEIRWGVPPSPHPYPFLSCGIYLPYFRSQSRWCCREQHPDRPRASGCLVVARPTLSGRGLGGWGYRGTPASMRSVKPQSHGASLLATTSVAGSIRHV